MDIEAMRDRTTECTPNTLEAIDDEIAEVTSEVAKMRGDTGIRAKAIVAIAEEIVEAGREIVAAEGQTGRRAKTCGWKPILVSTVLVAAIGDNDLARSVVGAAFEHATGKRVADVGYRWSGHPRRDDCFMIYWQDDVPAGWWTIPVPYRMRGTRRGSVRHDVRNWLNANTRRGTVTVVEQWEMTPEGDGIIRPAVAFEDQTNAAMFRLSWL